MLGMLNHRAPLFYVININKNKTLFLPKPVEFTALVTPSLSSPKSNCSLFVLWSAVAAAAVAVGSGAYAVATAGSSKLPLVSGWLPASDVTAERSFLVLGGSDGGGLVPEVARRGNCRSTAAPGFS